MCQCNQTHPTRVLSTGFGCVARGGAVTTYPCHTVHGDVREALLCCLKRDLSIWDSSVRHVPERMMTTEDPENGFFRGYLDLFPGDASELRAFKEAVGFLRARTKPAMRQVIARIEADLAARPARPPLVFDRPMGCPEYTEPVLRETKPAVSRPRARSVRSARAAA